MLISQVTVADLKGYSNVYHDMDDSLFQAILMGAKAFLSNYTGKAVYELDQHEDLTIALFILSNEMYDNRMVHVEYHKVGFVIKQLLDSHATNLL
ncbi:head-tail connector protein [Paenibacillus sp. Soil724D2]|uniref:head-tail connector protein n=1 Tax=Paenibacillus sp. (strain Soil724D2) TaxID=1736392 RepID=UPI000712512F|nr:head-tail connector protein [Paenibacillus sp. Soil724D2]KRE33423.1 hypothetical protein ASG85_14245 [Paenibacillus sp. Soil724D2]